MLLYSSSPFNSALHMVHCDGTVYQRTYLGLLQTTAIHPNFSFHFLLALYSIHLSDAVYCHSQLVRFKLATILSPFLRNSNCSRRVLSSVLFIFFFFFYETSAWSYFLSMYFSVVIWRYVALSQRNMRYFNMKRKK